MNRQAASIANRLCEAASPHSFQNWEDKDGYYVATCRVSHDDVSELINIASKWLDPEWPRQDFGLRVDLHDVEMLPVTAWRTLADLKSGESVEPLIGMLGAMDDETDDWASVELPHVFGKIGQPAIDAVARLANDTDKPDCIRAVAADSLHRIAEYHPQLRNEAVGYLAELMKKVAHRDCQLSSILLVALVELEAVEAAEDIEIAFAKGILDTIVIGDWNAVRRRLGVEGRGLEMSNHACDSIESVHGETRISTLADGPCLSGDGVLPNATKACNEAAQEGSSDSDATPEISLGESVPSPQLSRGVRIGRNDPCPCGSGKKFKKCCR